ncbi:MAG: D-alanyl-D-alanine carboxypeptidase [Candidatus Pacebacteria bacterium]|nr:D-alanyl-D-alanine carboxypeptidase [Candidatus Paceibacterota bacterium]
MRKNHNDLFIILILVVYISIVYVGSTKIPVQEEAENSVYINDREILGQHVIAYDVNTGTIVYEKNADDVVPLASLTKIMTAIVVAEFVPENEQIYITERALREEGDNGLIPGSYWSRNSLLTLMLVESSNDAAFAFVEYFETQNENLVEKMNEKANSLGLLSLHFTSSNGLDHNKIAGGQGNARDVAHLLAYAWTFHSEIFASTTLEYVSILSHDTNVETLKNTNKSIAKIPGRVFSKTGMTEMAGGNLGVIAEKGLLHPFVVVVLGSTEQGRFSDVEMIVERIFSSNIQVH